MCSGSICVLASPVVASCTRVSPLPAGGCLCVATALFHLPCSFLLGCRVQALKRKKMYEQQRDATLRTAFNVEQVCVLWVAWPGTGTGTGTGGPVKRVVRDRDVTMELCVLAARE